MNTGVPWPSDVVDTTVAWSRVLAMQTKLHRWATADPGRGFDDVFNLVHDPAFLMAAWDRVRGNKGGRTAGVDGIVPRFVPAEDVIGMLADLRQQVKSGEFTPLPVRQRIISKGNGKTRSLGIPAMTDRIVQASLKLVLEPIFEADFEPCSYGLRPRRRAQDAVAEIHFYTTGNRSYEWVFEGDIKACFDEIDHTALMERVRGRIADKRVLGLIRAFLKAGVLTEDGLNRDTRTGTPQGGILTPPTQVRTSVFLLVGVFICCLHRGGGCAASGGDAVADGDVLGADQDLFDEQGPPRKFRTVINCGFQAACCWFQYSSWTSCGVR